MAYDYTRVSPGDKIRDNQTLQDGEVVDSQLLGQWLVLLTIVYKSGLTEDKIVALIEAPQQIKDTLARGIPQEWWQLGKSRLPGGKEVELPNHTVVTPTINETPGPAAASQVRQGVAKTSSPRVELLKTYAREGGYSQGIGATATRTRMQELLELLDIKSGGSSYIEKLKTPLKEAFASRPDMVALEEDLRSRLRQVLVHMQDGGQATSTEIDDLITLLWRAEVGAPVAGARVPLQLITEQILPLESIVKREASVALPKILEGETKATSSMFAIRGQLFGGGSVATSKNPSIKTANSDDLFSAKWSRLEALFDKHKGFTSRDKSPSNIRTYYDIGGRESGLWQQAHNYASPVENGVFRHSDDVINKTLNVQSKYARLTNLLEKSSAYAPEQIYVELGKLETDIYGVYTEVSREAARFGEYELPGLPKPYERNLVTRLGVGQTKRRAANSAMNAAIKAKQAAFAKQGKIELDYTSKLIDIYDSTVDPHNNLIYILDHYIDLATKATPEQAPLIEEKINSTIRKLHMLDNFRRARSKIAHSGYSARMSSHKRSAVYNRPQVGTRYLGITQQHVEERLTHVQQVLQQLTGVVEAKHSPAAPSKLASIFTHSELKKYINSDSSLHFDTRQTIENLAKQSQDISAGIESISRRQNVILEAQKTLKEFLYTRVYDSEEVLADTLTGRAPNSGKYLDITEALLRGEGQVIKGVYEKNAYDAFGKKLDDVVLQEMELNPSKLSKAVRILRQAGYGEQIDAAVHGISNFAGGYNLNHGYILTPQSKARQTLKEVAFSNAYESSPYFKQLSKYKSQLYEARTDTWYSSQNAIGGGTQEFEDLANPWGGRTAASVHDRFGASDIHDFDALFAEAKINRIQAQEAFDSINPYAPGYMLETSKAYSNSSAKGYSNTSPQDFWARDQVWQQNYNVTSQRFIERGSATPGMSPKSYSNRANALRLLDKHGSILRTHNGFQFRISEAPTEAGLVGELVPSNIYMLGETKIDATYSRWFNADGNLGLGKTPLITDAYTSPEVASLGVTAPENFRLGGKTYKDYQQFLFDAFSEDKNKAGALPTVGRWNPYADDHARAASLLFDEELERIYQTTRVTGINDVEDSLDFVGNLRSIYMTEFSKAVESGEAIESPIALHKKILSATKAAAMAHKANLGAPGNMFKAARSVEHGLYFDEAERRGFEFVEDFLETLEIDKTMSPDKLLSHDYDRDTIRILKNLRRRNFSDTGINNALDEFFYRQGFVGKDSISTMITQLSLQGKYATPEADQTLRGMSQYHDLVSTIRSYGASLSDIPRRSNQQTQFHTLANKLRIIPSEERLSPLTPLVEAYNRRMDPMMYLGADGDLKDKLYKITAAMADLENPDLKVLAEMGINPTADGLDFSIQVNIGDEASRRIGNIRRVELGGADIFRATDVATGDDINLFFGTSQELVGGSKSGVKNAAQKYTLPDKLLDAQPTAIQELIAQEGTLKSGVNTYWMNLPDGTKRLVVSSDPGIKNQLSKMQAIQRGELSYIPFDIETDFGVKGGVGKNILEIGYPGIDPKQSVTQQAETLAQRLSGESSPLLVANKAFRDAGKVGELFGEDSATRGIFAKAQTEAIDMGVLGLIYDYDMPGGHSMANMTSRMLKEGYTHSALSDAQMTSRVFEKAKNELGDSIQQVSFSDYNIAGESFWDERGGRGYVATGIRSSEADGGGLISEIVGVEMGLDESGHMVPMRGNVTMAKSSPDTLGRVFEAQYKREAEAVILHRNLEGKVKDLAKGEIRDAMDSPRAMRTLVARYNIIQNGSLQGMLNSGVEDADAVLSGLSDWRRQAIIRQTGNFVNEVETVHQGALLDPLRNMAGGYDPYEASQIMKSYWGNLEASNPLPTENIAVQDYMKRFAFTVPELGKNPVSFRMGDSLKATADLRTIAKDLLSPSRTSAEQRIAWLDGLAVDALDETSRKGYSRFLETGMADEVSNTAWELIGRTVWRNKLAAHAVANATPFASNLIAGESLPADSDALFDAIVGTKSYPTQINDVIDYTAPRKGNIDVQGATNFVTQAIEQSNNRRTAAASNAYRNTFGMSDIAASDMNKIFEGTASYYADMESLYGDKYAKKAAERSIRQAEFMMYGEIVRQGRPSKNVGLETATERLGVDATSDVGRNFLDVLNDKPTADFWGAWGEGTPGMRGALERQATYKLPELLGEAEYWDDIAGMANPLNPDQVFGEMTPQQMSTFAKSKKFEDSGLGLRFKELHERALGGISEGLPKASSYGVGDALSDSEQQMINGFADTHEQMVGASERQKLAPIKYETAQQVEKLLASFQEMPVKMDALGKFKTPVIALGIMAAAALVSKPDLEPPEQHMSNQKRFAYSNRETATPVFSKIKATFMGTAPGDIYTDEDLAMGIKQAMDGMTFNGSRVVRMSTTDSREPIRKRQVDDLAAQSITPGKTMHIRP